MDPAIKKMEVGEEFVAADRCAVCLEVKEQPSHLNACDHVFCRKCITAWSQTRRMCPLCNAEFTSISFLSLEAILIEEPIAVPFAKEADLTSDLEALDHTYFLREARRLLNAAEEAQRVIVRAQKQRVLPKYGSKFQDSHEERNWNLLQSVVSRLQVNMEVFHSDQRLDPTSVLQDLYDIQEQMDQVWRSPQQNELSYENQGKHQRYSADDYDALSSEEDEEEYEYYEGRGRNDNRKDRKHNGRVGLPKATPSQPSRSKK